MKRLFSTLREANRLAKIKVSRKKWNWMNCGSEREYTLNENLNSFKKYKIKQKILTNVSNLKTKKKFPWCKIKISNDYFSFRLYDSIQ